MHLLPFGSLHGAARNFKTLERKMKTIKITLKLYFVLGLGLLFYSCGSDGGGTPNGGQGTSYGVATLSWSPPTTHMDGSPLSPSEIKSYQVYYGKETSLTPSNSQQVNVGNATSYTVTGLSSGAYQFAVTTIDTNNNESGFSTIGSKNIP